MSEKREKISSALARVRASFPFKDYLADDDGSTGPYSNIAATVLRYLPQPDSCRILDFGAGACDKTAVLQMLGYKCSACDDLQDDWHKLPGSCEKITSFAAETGIDFKLLRDLNLPFAASEFSMVMLHDVLEHLHDSPRCLLNRIVEFIAPGGFLFITVPNAVNIRKRLDVLRGRSNLPDFSGYYWYPGSWRGHIREYVRSDLQLLAKYLGLEIIELRGCDHMLHKVPAMIKPLYLKITDFFDSLKDSWLLVAKKPVDWRPRLDLPAEDAARILGKNSYTPGSTVTNS